MEVANLRCARGRGQTGDRAGYEQQTQHTLLDWLPIGQGIVTFQDLPDILRGIETINGDYERHCQAARRLAEEHFSTDKVLPTLLAAGMG